MALLISTVQAVHMAMQLLVSLLIAVSVCIYSMYEPSHDVRVQLGFSVITALSALTALIAQIVYSSSISAIPHPIIQCLIHLGWATVAVEAMANIIIVSVCVLSILWVIDCVVRFNADDPGASTVAQNTLKYSLRCCVGLLMAFLALSHPGWLLSTHAIAILSGAVTQVFVPIGMVGSVAAISYVVVASIAVERLLFPQFQRFPQQSRHQASRKVKMSRRKWRKGLLADTQMIELYGMSSHKNELPALHNMIFYLIGMLTGS